MANMESTILELATLKYQMKDVVVAIGYRLDAR